MGVHLGGDFSDVEYAEDGGLDDDGLNIIERGGVSDRQGGELRD